MKQRSNLTFSDEVSSVLEKAFEDCYKNNLECTTLESVVYFLAKEYKSEDENAYPECDGVLWEMIDNGLDMDGITEEYENSKTKYKANLFIGQLVPTELVPSEELEAVFKELEKLHDKKDIINAFEFLSAIDSAKKNSGLQIPIAKYVNLSDSTVKDWAQNALGDMFDLLKKATEGFRVEEKKDTNGKKSKDQTDDDLSKLGKGNFVKKEKSCSWSPDPNDEKIFEAAGGKGGLLNNNNKTRKDGKTPFLDQYSIEMTERAISNPYDPVIGRDREIEEIVKILSSRLCNNPLLLGDPGVGKTAIVESLATLIATKSSKIPEAIRNKRIFSLNINSVVAGCTYRGQFEERMQNIIKEVVADPDIIVYIDEIHNMVGAGASSGEQKGDMGNILKPYLSRGEFQCIGSTTVSEFRNIIEKDKALVRRFGTIYVEEPSLNDTIKIIEGVASKYENYHKVKYPKEIIRACVNYSDRYIYDSCFPSKAVKILDKVGASVKIKQPENTKVKDLENNIDDLEKQKFDIITKQFDNWEKACELKDQTDDLKKELTKVKKDLETNSSNWPMITLDNVCEVISSTTGIPLDRISSTDTEKLRSMKKRLDNKVIGQEEAVEELSIAIQQNTLGLRDPKKPIASFLFVGPTGVGKTYVAKTVAKEFFGSDKNLVTISCSEYMEKYSESKLIGTAPGYVGYDSEPRLYILKRQPYTVLLVDEIEKSNSDLYNIWLNMLEEGEITLSTGEKISCRNCIIIFTGNVGTKSLEIKGSGLGFGKLSADEKKKADVSTVMKEVEKEFRPEFLNRLTKIVVFNSLDEKSLNKIFDLELKTLRDQVKSQNKLNIKVSKEAKNLIISKCDPKYGARSLKRLINEYVLNEICKKMLQEDVTGKQLAEVNLVSDKIEVAFS